MNKTFLITGASAGLGEKFTTLISESAKNIIIVGRNNRRLIKLKKKINKINPKVNIIYFTEDLSTNSGVNNLIKKFNKQKKIKFIDVLVNSAANFTVKKIENVSHAQIKKDFQLNVFSPFILSRYFGLKMKKKIRA